MCLQIRNITGTNICQQCRMDAAVIKSVYSQISQIKKTYYHPLNLTATYLTLVNDTGYRGNLN